MVDNMSDINIRRTLMSEKRIFCKAANQIENLALIMTGGSGFDAFFILMNELSTQKVRGVRGYVPPKIRGCVPGKGLSLYVLSTELALLRLNQPYKLLPKLEGEIPDPELEELAKKLAILGVVSFLNKLITKC